MRVIHIVHGRANPNGHNGISRVVYHLNKQEQALGVDSEIWAVVDDAKTHYTHRRDEFVTVECFPRVRWPLGRNEIIDRLIAERGGIDLVHFHMIWFYDKNLIAKALKKAKVPFVITTHGTYSKPHAWTGRRRLARRLFELDYLNAATEIHAITVDEADALGRYGYRGPTFLAPNGIALEEIPAERRSDYFTREPGDERVRLIWIGVKREDKNLRGLIQGVALLPAGIREQIVFSIVGPDHKGSEAAYITLADELGVRNAFEFFGPLYGKEKYDAIESADLHILPSLSEVFSLAMLDAMACEKPCLVSEGCGYGQFDKDDFFIEFEPTPEGIAGGIAAILERRRDWRAMGRSARHIVERDLNWSAIAKTMVRNYSRIVEVQ